MAFFGIEVRPGNPYTHRSEKSKGRLLISMASLGLGTATSNSVLQCKIGNGSPRILCSLFPEIVESFPLHFEFFELRKKVVFSVIGPLSIHISGYYLDHARIKEEEPESCVLDMSDRSDQSYDETDTFSNSSASKSGDESQDEKKPKKKKKKKKNIESAEENSTGKSQSPVEENNASEKYVEDDKKTNDAEASKIQDEKKPKKKKKKIMSAEENSAAKTQSPVEENNASSKDVEDDKKPKKKKIKSAEENSAAKTQLPVEENNASSKYVEDDKKTNNAEASKVRNEKKPKKKKIKSTEENSAENTQSPVEENKDVEDDKKTNAKASNVRTLQSGLEIEELKPGESDGKVAVAGKEISVRYVCKLKSTGRVIDSNILHNLLKFRIGARKVTEGWEDGVEGMRVGEKRRLTVPPLVGVNGKVRDGENVPRDSWLVYEVELVKVKG